MEGVNVRERLGVNEGEWRSELSDGAGELT
jgi:hypothetical protein